MHLLAGPKGLVGGVTDTDTLIGERNYFCSDTLQRLRGVKTDMYNTNNTDGYMQINPSGPEGVQLCVYISN